MSQCWCGVQQEWPLTDIFGWGLGNRQTLSQHLAQIAGSENAVLLYLRDPHGERLPAQIRSLAQGQTVPEEKPPQHAGGMDPREYGIGAQNS